MTSRICGTCKFWSAMIAQVDEGSIRAVCLCTASPKRNRYVWEYGVCGYHARGTPVDAGDGLMSWSLTDAACAKEQSK